METPPLAFLRLSPVIVLKVRNVLRRNGGLPWRGLSSGAVGFVGWYRFGWRREVRRG